MKEQTFANAFAATIAVVYVVCAGWVVVARDSFMGLTGTWVHGIDMKSLPFVSPTAGGLIVGFMTSVIAAWAAGYLFAWLYNQFSKKQK